MVTAAYPLLSGPTKAVGFLIWFILVYFLPDVIWRLKTLQIFAAWKLDGFVD
jgi:hypothetical protein